MMEVLPMFAHTAGRRYTKEGVSRKSLRVTGLRGMYRARECVYRELCAIKSEIYGAAASVPPLRKMFIIL
jgi:hypothetical protein